MDENQTPDGAPDVDTSPDNPAAAAIFDAVRESLRGQPTLSLEDVAREAGLPVRILQDVFEAMEWADRDAYDERDVEYAKAVASTLDHYPLDVLVRSIGTRYRSMASIVVSDLGTVRDEVVMPALASGADPEELASTLARTADTVLPLVTENLAEDYRHVLLNLLDTDALARGVGGGREITLAVGFIDVAGYTALSGRVDPTGLDRVLSRFEDLVHTAVTEHGNVMLAKFIGDAAMLVASDPVDLATVLLGLVNDETTLAEAPRKAGMASGEVLVRQGDYYGPTPNLAARLTDHARPWSLLAAEGLHDVLDDHFSLHQISKTKMRGVGETRPYRVYAAGHDED